MVGLNIYELYPKLPDPSDETILSVNGLTLGKEYRNISFELHRGEILGLAGLVGAGRTALARGIFGLDPPSEGRVFLRGNQARFTSTAESIIADGGAILMISSDLPELLGMSHRIGVMRRGELVAMLQGGQTNQEEIMNYAALERT